MMVTKNCIQIAPRKSSLFPRLISRTLMLLAIILMLPVTPAAAIDIKEVVSPAGIKAWLVEDYTVPVVSVSFEFEGGSNTDPAGKEGLTSLLAAMMDEGAGDMDTTAFKNELELLGMEAGFSASRDNLSGGMRMVASDAVRGFELMAMMLNRPAFEEHSLGRIRAGYIAAHERSLQNPRSILGRAMRESLFPDHPYSHPFRGTADSLAAITREDIIAHHRRLMARDNLYIGVVGAISPEQLGKLLDNTFSNLPEAADFDAVKDVEPVLGERRHLEFETPQSLVSLALPARRRKDKGFFAAYLVNHILGGGTFSSRLYQAIREERGLAYSISSSISNRVHTAYLSAGFATRNDQADAALDIMLEQIKKMAEEGPSAEELEFAKRYIIGSYAVNNLDTSSSIADVLVGLQVGDLGIDYIQTREAEINAVTLEDAKQAAREMLGAKPTVITIGPPRS